MKKDQNGFFFPLNTDKLSLSISKNCPVLHPYYENLADPDVYILPDDVSYDDAIQAILGSRMLIGEHYGTLVEQNPVDDLMRSRAAQEQGKEVLFSGRPCRVASGRRLGWDRSSSVYTVDYFCKGITSRLVADSLKPLEDHRKKILSDCVRRGMVLRESCGYCPWNRFPRQGDISIGDIAGKRFLSVNNDHGRGLVAMAGLDTLERVLLEDAITENPYVSKPLRLHRNRKFFFSDLRTRNIEDNVRYHLDAKADCITLNFGFGPNYGGVLTEYALQEVLKDIGLKPRLGWCYVPSTWGETFGERFARQFIATTHVCTCAAEVEALNDLTDTFIVGSDQVWRDEFCRHFNGIFYLDFVRPGHKKIACSVSFGREAFDGGPEVVRKVKPLIQDFDFISVREEKGIEICKNTFDMDAEWMPDPVFGLDASRYRALAEYSKRKRHSGYVAAYFPDLADDLSDQLVSIVSRKLNRPVVRLHGIEVVDWLWLLENSDFVVCNSFHGTCFSLIFHKPFLFFQNPLGLTANRLDTLLGRYGLYDRFTTTLQQGEDFENYFCGINYAAIQQLI
ncbi:MAG: polysaccharide pyruvyl transferase family protein, partial [Planctomycetes bacterium]|nr:polysaccharide pyruvyl transferase family protein [Planctomycetota bacterium]